MSNRIIAFLIAGTFLANTLSAVVTTTPISYAEFTQVFDYANSKPQTAENLTPVWYVQYQAGDGVTTSNSDPQSHELEIGDLTGSAGLPGGEAEFDWTPNSVNSYSYSVVIDGNGNIDSTFESAAVADNQTASFNKIYFGLYVNNNADAEYIQITHNYNSETISSLLGNRTLPDNFVGFALEDNTKIINIADFDLQGQITLFMKGNAFYEEWSYTIVGINSVPEPTPLYVTTISTDSDFFNIPLVERSFHLLMRENGTDPVVREILIGDGDFAIPADSINHEADFSWIVNTSESFTLQYSSETSNLNISIGSVSLTDQPLAPIQDLYIGNNNQSGLTIQGLNLTELTLNGFALPDLNTIGPDNFSGIKVEDIPSDWILNGKITFTSDLAALAHNASSIPIFGSTRPPTELKVTAFNYDANADTLTFTWDSSPAATYSINYTDDLSTTFSDVLNASIPSGGASTIYGPVANPVPSAAQLFFKISENAQ